MQCAAVITWVASTITPPQKNPTAGGPACGLYSATWKGKRAIEVLAPPTMLSRARGDAAKDPDAATSRAPRSRSEQTLARRPWTIITTHASQSRNREVGAVSSPQFSVEHI